MPDNKYRFPLFLAALALASSVFADDDPRHERHELMESVGEAAKPVGEMLKGEAEFDADTLLQSLNVWKDVGGQFGGLFPEGSETGMGTEAAPAIWEDRAGFEKALAKWQAAVDGAIEAGPDSLEAAKPVIGPVFEACKGCHDNYRIAEE
ncbi:MAG: cytochrome c [Woeseiaceae bacterium]|nr:cytochrome c [Woeseiaceae bacterium]NIP21962.1 cytochrome c [Woeseiaceae bacterium]NIS91086.1 cytochrome c [Woeseiaceae bacterium]